MRIAAELGENSCGPVLIQMENFAYFTIEQALKIVMKADQSKPRESGVTTFFWFSFRQPALACSKCWSTRIDVARESRLN